MKKVVILMLAVFSLSEIYAEVFEVGINKTYKKPSEVVNLVSDGDTVQIDAGLYEGDACVWYANDLYITGVGGKAHLKADGAHSQGKAIWVIVGDDYIVEHIEFSDCKVPDKNGAGIRFEGTGIVIRYCYFHDNENGILTDNNDQSEILIEFCEFKGNGYGDGYTHNMYINHVKSFTIRYCYTHQCNVGHNIKTRAYNNYILYNRIMDESTGNASMLIDVPNGGFTVIMGNLIMQGPNATNKNMVTYGLEGLTNSNKNIFVVNNTFLNERVTCNPVVIKSSAQAMVANNIFTGTGNLDPMISDTLSNIYFSGAQSVGFVDHTTFDYHLTGTSKCIDAGTDLSHLSVYQLVPHDQYKYDMGYESRPKDQMIDIGAFEFKKNNSVAEEEITYHVYPNPCDDMIRIRGNFSGDEVILIDNLGRKIKHVRIRDGQNEMLLKIADCEKGIYYLMIRRNSNQVYTTKILKTR